jgi:hypothetical protein
MCNEGKWEKGKMENQLVMLMVSPSFRVSISPFFPFFLITHPPHTAENCVPEFEASDLELLKVEKQ